MHGLRIARHDAIVKMAASSLNRQGMRTLTEPRIEVGHKKWLVPDLVCVTKDKKKVIVIDPIVSSESKNLELVFKQKVIKYSGEEFQAGARKKALGPEAQNQPVETFGMTFNTRGSCSRSTRKLVRKLFPQRYGDFLALRILVATAKMILAYRRTVHLNR